MDRIKAPIKKIQKIRLYCRQLIFYIYNFLRHLFVNNADRLEDITRNVVLHVERFLLSCIKRFCSSVRVFISNTSRDLLICSNIFYTKDRETWKYF